VPGIELVIAWQSIRLNQIRLCGLSSENYHWLDLGQGLHGNPGYRCGMFQRLESKN